MSDAVVSQTGLRFLSPSLLIFCIEHIENRFPGWWWSISQQVGKVTISIAPTRACPTIEDVAISKTKKGDSGCIRVFSYGDKTDNNVVVFGNWFSGALAWVDAYRNQLLHEVREEHPEFLNDITLAATRRKQVPMDLKILQSEYERFLSNVSGIEQYGGHRIENIYLGSCELSVDCSLRGKRKDGSEFDISMDFQGSCRLYDSLDYCHRELTSEVLAAMQGIEL